MNIRTILVPVDFSACSHQLVQQAAGLAARLGARVVILHVAELPPGVAPDAHVRPDGQDHVAAAWLAEDTRARLATFVREARAAGVEARADVRVGAVTPTILDAVEADRADLIVMSTHGRTGLARVVLGSVAEGVAHRTNVPVMLIRRDALPEHGDCEVDRSPVEQQLAAEVDG